MNTDVPIAPCWVYGNVIKMMSSADPTAAIRQIAERAVRCVLTKQPITQPRTDVKKTVFLVPFPVL